MHAHPLATAPQMSVHFASDTKRDAAQHSCCRAARHGRGRHAMRLHGRPTSRERNGRHCRDVQPGSPCCRLLGAHEAGSSAELQMHDEHILRGQTDREVSQHWRCVSTGGVSTGGESALAEHHACEHHANVCRLAGARRAAETARAVQPSRAAALAPAHRSTGLTRQRAVERTHGRWTALCSHEVGWCAAGYRQRGSSRRVQGHRRAGQLRGWSLPSCGA